MNENLIALPTQATDKELAQQYHDRAFKILAELSDVMTEARQSTAWRSAFRSGRPTPSDASRL